MRNAWLPSTWGIRTLWLLSLLIAGAAFAQVNPPSLGGEPSDRVVPTGGSVVFTVSAYGTLPFSYRWFHGASELSGETNWTLSLSNLTSALAGDYSVIVANSAGSITSAPASLVVLPLLPGMLDPTFDPSNGPNGVVRAVAPAPGGGVYIGGDFTNVNGVARGGMARLNQDGSLDASFPAGSGFLATVYAMAVQTNSQLLVGGFVFNAGDGVQCSLVRFNADGTLDASFSRAALTGGGLPSIRAIALQSDGRILIGGGFDSVNGTARRNIARLNSNGTLDTTFAPRVDNPVSAMALQPDGRVLIGGYFTTVNDTPRNRVARLMSNGAIDPSFDPGAGANSWVYALVLEPDGKVIVGGHFGGGFFNGIPGTGRNYLARLNSDGTLDAPFNQGRGPDDAVLSIALQPDGKIVLGGGFNQINGEYHPRIVRLNSDSTVDRTFYFEATASDWVESVALQSDGKILIGGAFTYVNGQLRARVARLLGGDPALFAPLITVQPQGQPTWGEGTDPVLSAKAVGFPVPSYYWQFNGTNLPGANSATLRLRNVRLANAGPYRLVASNSVGSVTSRVAFLNITPAPTGPGAVDIDFYTGDGPDYTVTGVSAQSDGSVLLCGYFINVDGVPRPRIARLKPDGSLDANFAPIASPSDVTQIAALPSGSAMVSGGFQTVNGTPQAGVALLTTNGALDSSFHPRFKQAAFVRSFLAQSNGQVVVAGFFVVTNLDGLARTNLARLNSDGSVDPTFDAGTTPADYIYLLAEYGGGKIVAVGNFTTLNGVPAKDIVRLNTNGAVDRTFNIGSGASDSINTLAVQADGKILIGGRFRFFNGVPRHQIARLNADGSVDSTFDVGPGPQGTVVTLRVQRDGKIMVAGGFYEFNGGEYGEPVRLNSDGSLDMTFASDVGNILSMAELPDGNWIVGGQGFPKGFVARLFGGYPPAFSPVIERHPASQSVQASEDVTLLVLAGGVPQPQYQWQLNGTNIPGATQWTFNVHNVRTANAGTYRVIVSNSEGSVTSSNATLIVNAPSLMAGAPDINFYTGLGPNDRVHAIAVQSDRNILIGGAFNQVNGTPRGRIARLTHSGGVDATFDPGVGANDRVLALALQPDGKVIAGGSFTNFNGLERNRIVRLNTNGLVDPSFGGAGVDAEVYAVAVQTNGSVLLGGRFRRYGTLPRNALARVLPNGSLDMPFITAFDTNAVVFSLAVQPDGKILAGGFFYRVGNSNWSHIARFNPDGSLDATFTTTGAGDTVLALALRDNGRAVAGGYFSRMNGIGRQRVAQLLENGLLDTAFTNAAPNNGVNAVLVQPDGRTILGGTFTRLGDGSLMDEYGQVVSVMSYERSRIARLETNGVVDLEFSTGAGFRGGSGYLNEYGEFIDQSIVLALAREADGKILVGGDFTTVNGITRPYLARLFGQEASAAVAVVRGQGMVQLYWDTGILQVADQVSGPWTDLPNAESPLLYQTGETQKFFRLKFN